MFSLIAGVTMCMGNTARAMMPMRGGRVRMGAQVLFLLCPHRKLEEH